MAYTTFQKAFWSDDYVIELDSKQKLVFNYLITNDKTQQCGIYQIALKKACFELGLSTEEFLLYLKKFSDDKKICYSLETSEICVINWVKHNSNTSWKTMESVKKQLCEIKNPTLVVLLYDPRKPLFEGTKRVKTSQGNYISEPFIIENPWKDYFKNLSDNDLLEIRKEYLPEGAYKGLARGIQGAFAIAEQNITNTEQNITNTEQNTNSTEHNNTITDTEILEADEVPENEEVNSQPFETWTGEKKDYGRGKSIMDDVTKNLADKKSVK